jgi:hypothetical protein
MATRLELEFCQGRKIILIMVFDDRKFCNFQHIQIIHCQIQMLRKHGDGLNFLSNYTDF